jgi:hypothetical protein
MAYLKGSLLLLLSSSSRGGGTYIPQLPNVLNLPFFRSFLARNAQLNPAQVFALCPAA